MKNILKINNLVLSNFKRFCSFKVFIEIFFNLFFRRNNLTYRNPRIYFAGSKSGNFGGPYLKIKKLKRFFPEKKWQFNIIYTLSNSPNLNNWSINIIKKRKIPLILNQNGVFYPSWYKGNWERQNLIISKAYNSADYVFWQSEFCKKASDKFLGTRYGQGEILYNAVDTERFHPIKKNSDSIFKFLITGNIRKQNNYRIHSVLEAIEVIVKRNQYIHLYIAGVIEDLDYFFNLIKKLKIEKYVTFIGPYSQKDAPFIYQEVDAYVTMSFQDNCPIAVIEAMSCGLPILYSSSGGVPELVGSKAGIGLEVSEDWENIRVPTKQQILNGFIEIIDKKSLMSDFARDRALKMFDIKTWIKRHKEVFDIFINKNIG